MNKRQVKRCIPSNKYKGEVTDDEDNTHKDNTNYLLDT